MALLRRLWRWFFQQPGCATCRPHQVGVCSACGFDWVDQRYQETTS